MDKKRETVLLLIGTLQASLGYIDYSLDTKIFSNDLKFTAKNFLVRLERWFSAYYKLNKDETEEVASQIELLITLYENSAKIAFQLNEKGEVVQDNFMNEFNELVKRYKIEI
jgi:hypothetical protein